VDADRLARFDREAKTLASLHHPNIAAVYGLERSGSTIALVMELVEGPTLANRIEQGPIPWDEALPLKPANIKVRADGTVKVLDLVSRKRRSPRVRWWETPRCLRP
jgi:serine/threonine-protein kinase